MRSTIRRVLGLSLNLLGTLVSAQPIYEYGSNRFFSLQSATYEEGAPKYGPFWGGLILGKGQTRFFTVTDGDHEELGVDRLGLGLDASGGLYISSLSSGKNFQVLAHSFAVCPLARHVQTNGWVAYTLPAYVPPGSAPLSSYLPGVVQYRGGFMATEIEADPQTAALVFETDFWPDWPFRTHTPFPARDAILDHVNSVEVTIPQGYEVYHGFYYFTGDFHSKWEVSLTLDSDTAEVHGAPLTYWQDERAGRMIITDVEVTSTLPGFNLSTNGFFASTDFASVFQLSAILAAFRDGAPREFSRFLASDC